MLALIYEKEELFENDMKLLDRYYVKLSIDTKEFITKKQHKNFNILRNKYPDESLDKINLLARYLSIKHVRKLIKKSKHKNEYFTKKELKDLEQINFAQIVRKKQKSKKTDFLLDHASEITVFLKKNFSTYAISDEVKRKYDLNISHTHINNVIKKNKIIFGIE